tara:strand:+ start:457 stop:870 length:414 start_codon:yes stop_codon:yes gene_type:complete
MAFKMKGSAFKLNEVATKSALKQQASPMKEKGVYKTILDEESGKEKIVQTTTDDPEASIYTGADANKHDTAGGNTPSAKLVKDRKKHVKSLYQTNEQAHSNELDANIQRKLDNNQPLTAVEKKAKANATRRLNMERN